MERLKEKKKFEFLFFQIRKKQRDVADQDDDIF